VVPQGCRAQRSAFDPLRQSDVVPQGWGDFLKAEVMDESLVELFMKRLKDL
jgi:hypothetical protein